MARDIPLLDLAAQHRAVGPAIDEAIEAVRRHGRFINGPEVAEFERAFAQFSGAGHCAGVANGTEAVTLALRALGVGPGDEVITTAMTFIATVESILHTGATPVLVDPELDTALTTADAVEAAITPRTAAVVVVHLYGQPVDLPAFRALADRRGLALVEDAAQAHGARFGDHRVGAVGDAAAFSFFPGKNLGAMGDAGGVTTNDEALAQRVRKLRDHGRVDKYRHDIVGSNARLDTIQAAILLAKLPYLAGWNAGRRAVAARYEARLAELDGITPIRQTPEAESVFHQYVVRVPERDAALDRLKQAGVAAGVHYPIPMHRQPALEELAGDAEFPNADRLGKEVLSLPMFPELTTDDTDRVVAAVAEHLAGVNTTVLAEAS